MNNYVKVKKNMFPELKNGNVTPIKQLEQKIITPSEKQQNTTFVTISTNTGLTKNEPIENYDLTSVNNIENFFYKHKSVHLFQQVLLHYFDPTKKEAIPEFIFEEIRYIKIDEETLTKITEGTSPQKLMILTDKILVLCKWEYLKHIGLVLIRCFNYETFTKFFDKVTSYELGLFFIKELSVISMYQCKHKNDCAKFSNYLFAKDDNIYDWFKAYSLSYALQNRPLVIEGHTKEEEPINGKPLKEEPINGKPLNEEPSNEKSLKDELIDDGPLFE